jgi:hypothetical protein
MPIGHPVPHHFENNGTLLCGKRAECFIAAPVYGEHLGEADERHGATGHWAVGNHSKLDTGRYVDRTGPEVVRPKRQKTASQELRLQTSPSARTQLVSIGRSTTPVRPGDTAVFGPRATSR